MAPGGRPGDAAELMRKVIGLVAAVVMICALKPHTIERFMAALNKPDASAAVVTPAAAAAQPENSYGSRSVTLRNDGRGHFQVEARVEGRMIDFLVDTGASMIALRETSAARLGIHPRVSDYTIRTQTANGVGKAAPVQLARVEVDGITVRDVQAFVVPDEQLSTNLLGMSFLSRVKWTHDRGKLVLEQ
jgi:aspartyl protease family protein